MSSVTAEHSMSTALALLQIAHKTVKNFFPAIQENDIGLLLDVINLHPCIHERQKRKGISLSWWHHLRTTTYLCECPSDKCRGLEMSPIKVERERQNGPSCWCEDVMWCHIRSHFSWSEFVAFSLFFLFFQRHFYHAFRCTRLFPASGKMHRCKTS